MTSKQHDAGGISRAGETRFAFEGVLASTIALISAAACCVLPLVFVSFGLGATALSFLVPYRWPLTLIAGLAIAAGWFVLFRNSPKGRRRTSTITLLGTASALLALAVAWEPFIEAPLIAWISS